MKAAVVIMMSLTRLDFYNFTFSITRGALTKIIKKASSYLYSNNVSNFTLRDKRTDAVMIL